VVAPLAGTTPLFVLGLSRRFLRDLEPSVMGITLTVLGVYLTTAL
jgi:hypothetical protein